MTIPPAMNDLMAGHVPCARVASAPWPPPAPSVHRSIPTFRPSQNRVSPAMPPPTGVPSWCRRGLPPEIVTALNAILTKALKAPEVQAAYGQQGMETLAGIRLE
jgi:hypothetical protein